MELKTEVKISPELLDLGNRIEAGIQAGLLRAAGAVEAAAVETAPVKTGNLANRIRKYLESRRAIIKSTAPYSIFVHEGTGLYGPHKTTFIRFFRTSKKGITVGSKAFLGVKMKGQKPNPFMARGFKKVENRIPGLFSGAIEEFIGKG